MAGAMMSGIPQANNIDDGPSRPGQRPVPGTAPVEGRWFRYLAARDRDDLQAAWHELSEFLTRLRAAEDERLADPDLKRRILARRAGRSTPTSGGLLNEDVAVELPDGRRYHGISFGGDLAGWDRGIRAYAAAAGRDVAELDGPNQADGYSLVLGDGERIALARCVVTWAGMGSLGHMPEPVEVRKVPLRHVSDASGLAELIDSGVIEADRVVAVIGKTEGNGGVNDYTRIIADRAFRDVLVSRGRGADDVARVPIVWSGGTDGVLSPHATIFATLPAGSVPATDEPRLTVGFAMSDSLLPEEIGRRPMIEKVAEAVKAAMARAGITDPADVHYVQTKT